MWYGICFHPDQSVEGGHRPCFLKESSPDKDPGKSPVIVCLQPIAGNVWPNHFQACDGNDVIRVLCWINLQQTLEKIAADRMKESG